MGCISSWERHAGMIPSDRPAERLGAPTPRIEIRGHQLLGQPYRRFDTLRSSSPAQPYFHPHPCSFWLTTLYISATRFTQECKPWDATCRKAGRGTQKNTAGLSVRGQ